MLFYASPLYSYILVLHNLMCRSHILLYADPIYSDISVMYTFRCQSFMLLYSGPTYSHRPMLYTLLCRQYILLYAGPTYSYITNLVCYTYFHWFFSPECQHKFRKQTGYIFQSPKQIKTWTTNITLHWINGIIRNNKCMFTKLNAVFYTHNGCMNKKILQRLIPSQIPDRFSKLLSSMAVP